MANSSSWVNKIVATKFNKDNYLISTVLNYNKLGDYYKIKAFHIGKSFKKYFVKRLKKFNFSYYLHQKMDYRKFANYNMIPSNQPYLKLFKRFEFDKKAIYKEYKTMQKTAFRFKKEKFFTNTTINFKNNKLNLNLNYLYFFGYSYFFLQHYRKFNYLNNINTKRRLKFFFENLVTRNSASLFLKCFKRYGFNFYAARKIINFKKFGKLKILKLLIKILLKFSKKKFIKNILIKLIKKIFKKFVKKQNQINKLGKFDFDFDSYFKKYSLSVSNIFDIMDVLRQDIKILNQRQLYFINKIILKNQKIFIKHDKYSKYILSKYKFLSKSLKIKINQINYLKLDSVMLNSFIIKKLNKNYSYISILKPLMKELKKHPTINGYRIKCKGRFVKKQRATNQMFKYGKIKYNNFNNFVSYTFNYTPLKYGVSAVKVWISYKNLKIYNNYKFNTLIKNYIKLKNIKK